MFAQSRLVPLIVSLLVLLIAHDGRAQALNGRVEADALTQGFHNDRNYFSPESWEYFDPVTGNLILTFTDLSLPGNAGRELKFQRTFNNLRSLGGPAAVSRWTFGFPGIVMNVKEHPITPGFDYMDELNTVLQVTPRLIMADGSERSTVFVERPSTSPSQDQSWRWVRSGEFFEYDIQANQLWMPDGTVSNYDGEGRLIGFSDPFGNTVALDWTTTPGSLVVTQ